MKWVSLNGCQNVIFCIGTFGGSPSSLNFEVTILLCIAFQKRFNYFFRGTLKNFQEIAVATVCVINKVFAPPPPPPHVTYFHKQ